MPCSSGEKWKQCGMLLWFQMGWRKNCGMNQDADADTDWCWSLKYWAVEHKLGCKRVIIVSRCFTHVCKNRRRMPTGRQTCNDVAHTCHRSLDAACSTTFIYFWHFWFGQARCVDAVPFAHAVGNFSTGRIGRKPSTFPDRHPLVIQHVTMENALNNVFVLTGLQTRILDWCSFIMYSCLVDGFQMF
jgi:hypothetical protein